MMSSVQAAVPHHGVVETADSRRRQMLVRGQQDKDSAAALHLHYSQYTGFSMK